MGKWQTKDQLKELTIALVEYGSISGSEAEIGIMEFVEYEIGSLHYFQQNKDHLQVHFTDDGRKYITALVKKENTKKTIILTGHLDVVGVDDYGEWKQLAFRPRELTEQLYNQKHKLPTSVQSDMVKGDWLFGRGTMDMKAGIALCLSMLEASSLGEFNGNILFLGVPDEEVNSVGMRTAVPKLLELSNTHQLDYQLIWNTEPMFSQFPGDEQAYLYQGSLGKLLPGFYCMGEEAHVAEPFIGLNGNFMASCITNLIELHPALSEIVFQEKTPPPSNLLQKDLKEEYSVQIPHTSVTIFNLFMMRKSMDEIQKQLLQLGEGAAAKIISDYSNKEMAYAGCHSYELRKRKISVLTYDELKQLGVQKVGDDEIERMISLIQANHQGDDRELSYRIVNELAVICKDKAPMIVLFYSPPYYPSVSSADRDIIKGLSQEIVDTAKREFQLEVEVMKYFPGLSDLSYASLSEASSELNSMTVNMPLWGNLYKVPIKEIESLNLAVFNFGPIGKDPHRWTERLNIDSSFEEIYDVMKTGINYVFQRF